MRQKRTKRKKNKISKETSNKKPEKQTLIRVFLNRYDFAYAGRDIVNQAAKVAPDIIKAATNDVDKIVEQRIN